MFRRILLFLIFSVCVLHAWGNSKAGELRKSMYAAPDTAKANILVSLARLYRYENGDSCIHYAQQAIEMAHRTHQDPALVDAETLMSELALEKKDYVGATNHRRTILEVTLRMRNWDMVMESYNAIAQTWLLRDNYAEAVEYLKQGLEIAKERNNLEQSKYYCQALIDSYRKLRNMDAVCEYYPQLMEVNRKVDAQAYSNRIEALQAERETLVAAATAADGTRTREEQPAALKIIHTAAGILTLLAILALVGRAIWYRKRVKPGKDRTQAETSAKAAAHDALVKNQASVFRFLTGHIYTGINALAQTIAHFEEEQGDMPVAMNSTLDRINNDIFALYGFFQNFTLLLQAQSKQLNPELTTVNIPQLAANLLADYEGFAAAKEIQLVNEVQNNTFAIADERLIDIVLRNMMSNAFKYAPVRTGRISVGTKVGTRVETSEGAVEDPAFIEVWVTDDGIGLTPEQAGKLFDLTDNLTLPGDPDAKGYGVGLAVCKAVIETFKGRIWAETKPGEGFCIRFCLPGAKAPEVKTMSLPENIRETGNGQDSPDNPLLLE
jgi:signal transduction histidine kinase